VVDLSRVYQRANCAGAAASSCREKRVVTRAGVASFFDFGFVAVFGFAADGCEKRRSH
jgi:hypothetical protein